jgi:hypothetical protein
MGVARVMMGKVGSACLRGLPAGMLSGPLTSSLDDGSRSLSTWRIRLWFGSGLERERGLGWRGWESQGGSLGGTAGRLRDSSFVRGHRDPES